MEGETWLSSSSTATFAPGQVVRIHGLPISGHMNGKEAVVVSVGTKRIDVRLIGEESADVYVVRPKHLVRIAENATKATGIVELG